MASRQVPRVLKLPFLHPDDQALLDLTDNVLSANLFHPVDEPFDIQDFLSAVCHYFSRNHIHKLMQ
jgi:hypothetical protein